MAVVRSRRTKQFFITIGPVEYYETIRQDFVDYFEGVEEYCVSVEHNHVNVKCHIHAYIAFNDLKLINEVREYIVWFDHTINIESVKSKRNVLLYVSKEDEEVYFNCRESLLAFSYRAKAWARRSPKFLFGDPFVLEHRQCYRVLQELHREIHDRPRGRRRVLPKPSEFWLGWPMQLLEYFHAAYGSLQGVKKALYIYGPTGVGKTYTVESLRSHYEIEWRSVYMPVPGQFFFGDFKPKVHELVMFEEYDHALFKANYEQLKRVMEGRFVSVMEKYGYRRQIRVQCPVVFVSNYAPYSDPPFLRRILLVDAINEHNGLPKAPVPKEEVDAAMEAQEIIEITSDEEDSHAQEAPLQTSWGPIARSTPIPGPSSYWDVPTTSTSSDSGSRYSDGSIRYGSGREAF